MAAGSRRHHISKPCGQPLTFGAIMLFPLPQGYISSSTTRVKGIIQLDTIPLFAYLGNSFVGNRGHRRAWLGARHYNALWEGY